MMSASKPTSPCKANDPDHLGGESPCRNVANSTYNLGVQFDFACAGRVEKEYPFFLFSRIQTNYRVKMNAINAHYAARKDKAIKQVRQMLCHPHGLHHANRTSRGKIASCSVAETQKPRQAASWLFRYFSLKYMV